MVDSAEIGRKLVIGRQALLEIDEKVNKVQLTLNEHFTKTRNDK